MKKYKKIDRNRVDFNSDSINDHIITILLIINMNKKRSYIFYTIEGTTFQPLLTAEYPDHPDIENCQILGWAKGCNPKEAFESLKSEYPWICDSSFEEVIGCELKNEKTHYFSLKNNHK
jgi:hypothetical protein